MSQLAISFDYTALDKTDRVVVEQKTAEIRDRMGRAAQNIFEMGQRFADVKARLKHGEFQRWLEVEFPDASYPSVARWMQVAEKFKSLNLRDLKIASSALYLLAAPSTPDDVRDQFIEQAKAGVEITHADVKAAVAPPNTQADYDREREELDAVDPLLAKHRDAEEKKAARRAEREESPADDETVIIGNDFTTSDPQTWGGRTIPADAPDLNVDKIVKNDPAVMWSYIVKDIQACIARIPNKDTLAKLPADKRKYFSERFHSFAKQMKEAV